jgi:hypothetical protein
MSQAGCTGCHAVLTNAHATLHWISCPWSFLSLLTRYWQSSLSVTSVGKIATKRPTAKLPGYWPPSDYLLRDTRCLVAFLDAEVEAKLDEDSASVPWWRSPRGLPAASKQVFPMNNSSHAADTCPFQWTDPANHAEVRAEHVSSLTCTYLLFGTNTPMTRVD